MKNKKIISVLSFLIVLIFSCFAEDVQIVFKLADGSDFTKTVKSDIKTLVLSERGNQFQNIKSISGLEKLTDLTCVNIYFMTFEDDFAFLEDVKSLKILGISSFTKSLKFLENLPELETADLSLKVMVENRTSIENTNIDLKKLKNLKKIWFGISYFDCHKPTPSKFDSNFLHIPPFVNVQNKPEIVLSLNQNNVEFSKKDRMLMKQYSKVAY